MKSDEIFGLQGKRALVVGGGLGMGEATSLLLARAGCDVGIADKERGRAEAVSEKIRGMGRKAEPIRVDVMDDDQNSQMIDVAERALGPLDILVTIVGRAEWRPLVDIDAATWDYEQKLNVRYVFLAATAFARSLMRQRKGGAITCIASVSGIQSAPSHAPYGAAKAALISLVRTMATEWAPAGIRVNAIAPGSIITPFKPDTPERVAHTRASHLPMKRRGTVEDIAKAALFLSSDMAAYITGHTLPVDGGWLAGNLMFDPSTAIQVAKIPAAS